MPAAVPRGRMLGTTVSRWSGSESGPLAARWAQLLVYHSVICIHAACLPAASYMPEKLHGDAWRWRAVLVKWRRSVDNAVSLLFWWLCYAPAPAPAEGPKRNEVNRERTYRTKEETEKSKNVTSTVVLTLLLIAVVVPMLQYYGYTAKD